MSFQLSSPNYKINSAAKRFLRYHPKYSHQIEEKLVSAPEISLWEYLDYPRLYNELIGSKLNHENFLLLKRQLKHSHIRFKHQFEYSDECYYRLLSDILKIVQIKNIKANYIIHQIDFEEYINSNLNLLFDNLTRFSVGMLEAPWRTLYPYLSENLCINGVSNNEERWTFLETEFKIRHGNLILKDFKFSVQQYDGKMAIIYVEYRIKAHQKSTPRPLRLKILAKYSIHVWQIVELVSHEIFNI
ncbi:MAG: hypothetical protein ACKOX3_00645 [Bacteroidota bacterium]